MSGSSSPVFFDVVDWREKLQNLMERQKERGRNNLKSGGGRGKIGET